MDGGYGIVGAEHEDTGRGLTDDPPFFVVLFTDRASFHFSSFAGARVMRYHV